MLFNNMLKCYLLTFASDYWNREYLVTVGLKFPEL